MWKVVFARVDDRLIHGQIMTRWMKGFPGASIVIVDDSLAVDNFMKNIYTMAAPPGVKVKVVSIDTALKEWNQKANIDEKVFLLFKDIQTIERTIKEGIPIKTLNIGGVAKMPDKKAITQSVNLNSQEAEILWNLHRNFGIEIYLQMVPDSEKLSINTVIEKYFPQLK